MRSRQRRSALEGTDLEAIKKETENLQQVGYKLAEVVYSTEGAQAGAAAETAERPLQQTRRSKLTSR